MRDTIIELYEKLQKDIEFDPIWIKKTKVKMFADEIVELCNLHIVSNNEVAVCENCGEPKSMHSKASLLCNGQFSHFKQTDC